MLGSAEGDLIIFEIDGRLLLSPEALCVLLDLGSQVCHELVQPLHQGVLMAQPLFAPIIQCIPALFSIVIMYQWALPKVMFCPFKFLCSRPSRHIIFFVPATKSKCSVSQKL